MSSFYTTTPLPKFLFLPSDQLIWGSSLRKAKIKTIISDSAEDQLQDLLNYVS